MVYFVGVGGGGGGGSVKTDIGIWELLGGSAMCSLLLEIVNGVLSVIHVFL